MVITEVRIKLVEENSERLQAFCSVTFDDAFVVRDLRILERMNGCGLFLSMPSRKLTDHCGDCKNKNHLRPNYCSQCGKRLEKNRAIRRDDGQLKLYADIAHPINLVCREMIQTVVLKAYFDEREKAKQPGYVCSYDDYDSHKEAV